MAASVVVEKLAAALHRRTHRVTSALAHAALEWVLIALLLINGMLAYAIARFADYFGLAPPCLLCSRVDRLFQADGGEFAGGAARLRDVRRASALGCCLSYRRLAEACGMCEGCLSSWKETRSGAGEKGAAMACSCCEAVVRNSLRELQEPREDHVEEKITKEEEDDHGYALLAQEEHDEEEAECPEQQDEVQGQDQQDEKAAAIEDRSLEVVAQGDEIAPENDRLFPVETLDEMTIADESGLHRDVEESYGMDRADYEQDSRDVDIRVVLEEKRMFNSAVATPTDAIEDSVVLVCPIPHPETATSDPDENSILQAEYTVEIGGSTAEEQHIAAPQVTEAVPEDDNRAAEVDAKCEVSIGSEICDHESMALEEPAAPSAAPDNKSSPLELESLHDASPTEQEGNEVEQEKMTDTKRLDPLPDEQNEAEEDKAPETLTYGVATPRSDRMFLFERRRSLSLSLDGSVASEMDSVDPSSVDQLKSALQAERKALSALYAELEEERNAAAIATNQTMAMINRLQEEKAAMQMEAFQYQLMMEEQSEYDQEALQLLNELVTKREREKQELERELELYRQKVQHYEDKERRRIAGFKVNGVSVSPSSNGTSVSSSSEDSYEASDCELGESSDGGNLQSSSDAALSPGTGQDGTSHLADLDDSLTYFEMERLSILEELKTLEERLFILEDDDVNTANAAAAHSSNDFVVSADGLRSPEYDFTITSDKAKSGSMTSICGGKSLLPLFDAVGDDNCDRMTSARLGEAEADNSTTKSVSLLGKGHERLEIIEEVDHVYERLQALEADKEFLRHCIKSLKKGDKGMNLLQEILQHLRELRSVDLQVRNAGDAFAANSG